ncbi:MAG TPA: 16S rRNA (uracil(1498)-N(3))-methyltransferase [Stenomitos sp.]
MLFNRNRSAVAQLQRLTIAASQHNDSTVTLTSEQQHYLTRVLRLKSGDRFIAIQEQGQWRIAQLQNPPQTAQLLDPIAIQTELEQPLTLLAALIKGQGFDDVVRAATELGVSTIVPLLTERTVVNPGSSKLERWRRIAAEAAEQSCRQLVPDILDPLPFSSALSLVQTERFKAQRRFISATAPNCMNLCLALEKPSNLGILMMVGPEGGWTTDEQSAAIAQGFMPVSLGRRVLKAVTASIAAIAILSAHIDAIHPQQP